MISVALKRRWTWLAYHGPKANYYLRINSSSRTSTICTKTLRSAPKWTKSSKNCNLNNSIGYEIQTNEIQLDDCLNSFLFLYVSHHSHPPRPNGLLTVIDQMPLCWHSVGTSSKRCLMSTTQLVDFLNKTQRDPRLNEILHPYANPARAKELITQYEPNKINAQKGQLSSDGFLRWVKLILFYYYIDTFLLYRTIVCGWARRKAEIAPWARYNR